MHHNLAVTLDGGGVQGHVLHYAVTVAMVGSAFLVFLYLWSKGRLDMDEEAKERMLGEEEEDY